MTDEELLAKRLAFIDVLDNHLGDLEALIEAIRQRLPGS